MLMNAIVACRQMGLVVDLKEWGWKGQNDVIISPLEPIYRSQVVCDEFDDVITACRADHAEDHSCDHYQDVYLKCKKPSWGGWCFVGVDVGVLL